MNKHFRVLLDPKYDSSLESWVVRYWSIDKCLTIRSPIPFDAGDVVELVDIVDSRIDVLPVPRSSDKCSNAPCLVILTSFVPLGDDQDYQFSTDGKSELLLVYPVSARGNKNYIILALVNHGVNETRIVGLESKSKAQLNFTLLEANTQ